jgi:hypothetical protein
VYSLHCLSFWNSRKVIQNICDGVEAGPWNSPGCLDYEGALGMDFFGLRFCAFFQGVFVKSVFFLMVFAGEVVVNCWLGRGFWMAVFLLRIYATFLRFIFAGFPFWEFAKIRSGELVGFWDVD